MDFSPIQLLIVLAIILLVFGAKRLPEIGRNLGSGAREFKDGITGRSDDTADGEAISGPPEREDEKVG
ncbi:twin-arginine translocase TatA/TatE family subunit [Miltoncostaea marina]|uniref:twin-arginine translocase TatA/TatE family subunit n=1 Tax=Miltoncostaea marina TaxID=2843215 RepID=UPI001C3C677A|nr:twin-arginine translocase TatA/TatE family subunit [Miltoncostaea marina]